MGIKYGRGWGGARISLSQGSVLSREYFPSSLFLFILLFELLLVLSSYWLLAHCMANKIIKVINHFVQNSHYARYI